MKKLTLLFLALGLCAGALIVPGRHDAAAFDKSVATLKQASADSAAALSKSSAAAVKLVETAGSTPANKDKPDTPQLEMKSASSDYAKTVAEANQRRDAQAEALAALKEEATSFRKRWAADIAKIKDSDLREHEQARYARASKRIDNNLARAELALQAMTSSLERAADVNLVARSIANDASADHLALAIDHLGNEVAIATNAMNAASAELLAGLDFRTESKG